MKIGFVSMTDLLEDAKKRKYAVGYFESWNLESLGAVIDAAEEMRSPVIIGFNGGILTNPERVLKPEDLEYFAAIGQIAAQKASVPVALILNEISSFQTAVKGIKFGFNAVMFESNLEDFEKSVSLTKKIVEVAHATGVSVESNVGQLPMADKGTGSRKETRGILTNPQEAERFVRETKVDALGISIGNVEVLIEGKAVMDFELLEKINKVVDASLVLHGGSGIADDDIGRVVELGVCKINLGARLNQTFFEGMKKVLDSTKGYVSPKYLLGSGTEEDIFAGGKLAMKELVKRKMGLSARPSVERFQNELSELLRKSNEGLEKVPSAKQLRQELWLMRPLKTWW